MGQYDRHYIVGCVRFQDTFKGSIEVFENGGRAEMDFEFIKHFLAARVLFNGCLVCLLLSWFSGVGHNFRSISILVDSFEKVE